MTTKGKLKSALLTAAVLILSSSSATAGDRGNRQFGTHHEGRSGHHSRAQESHQQHDRGRYEYNYRHDAGRYGHIPPRYRGQHQRRHNYRGHHRRNSYNRGHHRHGPRCGHNYRRHDRYSYYDSGYYLTQFLFDYARYDD